MSGRSAVVPQAVMAPVVVPPFAEPHAARRRPRTAVVTAVVKTWAVWCRGRRCSASCEMWVITVLLRVRIVCRRRGLGDARSRLGAVRDGGTRSAGFELRDSWLGVALGGGGGSGSACGGSSRNETSELHRRSAVETGEWAVAPGRCGHINHLVVSESVSQLVVTFPLWSVTRVREFCQSSEVWRFSGNFCATTRFLQRCLTRRKDCKKWNRSQSEDLVPQAFAAAADSSSCSSTTGGGVSPGASHSPAPACSSTTGGGVCSRSEAQIVPVARPLRAASPLEVGSHTVW